ncbi:MAG: hypothetical protein K5795_07010 [Lachnospiraceae bacterium]|nr:hypothetical protein [Lachnospiraceae bacterium]
MSNQKNVYKLVYLEEMNDVEAAISREKQLKGWNKDKKTIWRNVNVLV